MNSNFEGIRGGRLRFKGEKDTSTAKMSPQDVQPLPRTQTELAAQERYRESVKNSDHGQKIRAFRERLSRQPEHNDIPNV